MFRVMAEYGRLFDSPCVVVLFSVWAAAMPLVVWRQHCPGLECRRDIADHDHVLPDVVRGVFIPATRRGLTASNLALPTATRLVPVECFPRVVRDWDVARAAAVLTGLVRSIRRRI